MTTILWTSKSANTKTGNIPQAFVGSTEADAVQTCKSVDCPLLPKRFGGKWESLSKSGCHGCYAWQGRVKAAAWGVRKAALKNAERYTLRQALLRSARSAMIVRYTAIGDGGLVNKEQSDTIVQTLKEFGVGLYGFTRAWRLNTSQHWKGRLMASCMDMEEADEAIAAGWRASVVLPQNHEGNTFTTPNGSRGVVCPYIQGKRVNCNSCRLCVASKPGPVIGFPSHR